MLDGCQHVARNVLVSGGNDLTVASHPLPPSAGGLTLSHGFPLAMTTMAESDGLLLPSGWPGSRKPPRPAPSLAFGAGDLPPVRPKGEWRPTRADILCHHSG